MKRLTLLAHIDAITGYGQMAVEMVRGLERITGCYIAIRPAAVWEPPWGPKVPKDIRQKFVTGPQPEAWEILMHPPNFVPTPGKRTVYYSMHETTKLAPMSPHVLNKAEAVVVPCQFCATSFSASGVTRPIFIVPLGVNPETFRYRPMPPDFPAIVRFGAAGRMAHGGIRKGMNEVVEAFSKAFPHQENVRLEVKGFPDCGLVETSDPRITIHREYWPDERLADWYASLTCFVSAAKGEGWGLMQHQAMSVGRPIISIRWSGVAEFFRDDLGYPLDFKLESAQFAYEGQGHWAVPTEASLIEQMRAVYAAPMWASILGAESSKAVQHLTWENSALALACVLEGVGAL